MAYVLLFIVIGIFWVISSIIEGIQSSNQERKKKEEKKKLYDEKFWNRVIDRTKSLKDRNQDIIDAYLLKIRKSEYRDYYYIDNLVRDCLNDIMLAEWDDWGPWNQYLSTWKRNADTPWITLSNELASEFKHRQKEIQKNEEEQKIQETTRKKSLTDIETLADIVDNFWGIENDYLPYLRSLRKKVESITIWKDLFYKIDEKAFVFLRDVFQPKSKSKQYLTIHIAKDILLSNEELLSINDFLEDFFLEDKSIDHLTTRKKDIFTQLNNIDSSLLNKKELNRLEEIKVILNERFSLLENELKNMIQEIREILSNLQNKRNALVHEMTVWVANKEREFIEKFISVVITYSKLNPFFQSQKVEYKEDTWILIIDYQFIDLDHFPNLKEEKIYKDGTIRDVPLSQKMFEDAYDQYLTAVCIRTMYALFSRVESISLISFNWWVHTINKWTGNEEDLFILSIQTKKEECLNLNLTNIDPKIAFRSLKWISAVKLSSLTPINPILKINTEDHRFVEWYNVVEWVNSRTNLAAMDWQDFENLIRELFGKEFWTNGWEVKITQASRDGWVDAIAFDPDPIRWGKIVIQAKRYTNTVDVSAVRDLHWTVQHEWANKWILVTTATFWSDSYDFIKNKPLTLIDWGWLLYLLEKHGYSAKIDLREAKKILNLKQK